MIAQVRLYNTLCSWGAEYVGETGRTLGKHIMEHRKAFESIHLEQSGIAKHGFRAGHIPLWDNMSILTASQNLARRQISGVWHTRQRRLALAQAYT